MKASFREWYPYTAGELRAIWQSARVVLDTSVLLGMYRYPQTTLDEFLTTLGLIEDRLWLPHQVALEYHRNREDRIPEQRDVLERLLRDIDRLVADLDRLAFPEHHPVLDLEATKKARGHIKDAFAALSGEVTVARDATPERADRDLILEMLTALFENRVGPPLTSEQTRQLFSEAPNRYAQKVPPGYKDAEKEEPRRYNDLVVWRQILQGTAQGQDGRGRATIFVTNDRKEDWWRRRGDQLVGPRTELVREYIDIAGADFVMYPPDQFLQDAKTILAAVVSTETIADVRRASESSLARDSLRAQRMILPDTAVRTFALARIYEVYRAGSLLKVEDLNRAIDDLGPTFADSNVSVPLFWALLRDAYGPFLVPHDASRRLRDREIQGARWSDSLESFIEASEAAWLAQALYRLRFDSFGEEELLTAFFGENYANTAVSTLRRATELVQADFATHGFRPL